MFGIFSSSYSKLPGSPPLTRTTPTKTFMRWLWRSKIVRLVVLSYATFSVVFSLSHLFRAIFQPHVPPPLPPPHVPQNFTYDTREVSPLNEMNYVYRYNKMHSKTSRLFTDSIHAYYMRGGITPNVEDVTATAFVTKNRFDDLVRLAEMWQGPISATFHVQSTTLDEKDPEVRKSLLSLKNLFTQNPILRRHVDIHLVAGPYSSKIPDILPRPTNFHLNVARFFARTDFVAYLDHDTWPSPGTREAIRRHKNLLHQNDVIILPTFAFAENSTTFQMPQTREQVIQLVQAGSMGLQDDGWELNRGPTSYTNWTLGKLYGVDEYELHYRPNFVSKRGSSIPWCTERFDNNKAACLYQIYITGSELWVVPDAFLVRHHLNPESHLLKPNESQWEKVINSRLYTKFYREACIHYRRQLVMAEEWKTSKADHLKQECDHVLASYGKGLI